MYNSRMKQCIFTCVSWGGVLEGPDCVQFSHETMCYLRDKQSHHTVEEIAIKYPSTDLLRNIIEALGVAGSHHRVSCLDSMSFYNFWVRVAKKDPPLKILSIVRCGSGEFFTKRQLQCCYFAHSRAAAAISRQCRKTQKFPRPTPHDRQYFDIFKKNYQVNFPFFHQYPKYCRSCGVGRVKICGFMISL